MTTFLLLILAGAAAGLVGYLTGLASLVSYPALLLAGLPPVSANITNTLGLVGAGAGSTVTGARIFLMDDLKVNPRPMLTQVVVAALGGLTGGVLLITTGESSFEHIVPWLVAFASALLLLSLRIKRLQGGHRVPQRVYLALLYCVCIYGGYFGAGAGVIYLAVTALASQMTFEKSVFVKSMLLAVSNLAAALFFIAFGPVDWLAALALGVGCVAGGYAGPPIQRLIPERVLRWAIGIAGFGLALWLARG